MNNSIYTGYENGVLYRANEIEISIFNFEIVSIF